MKKTLTFMIIALSAIAGVFFIVALSTDEVPTEPVAYIATFNHTLIPLDQYKLYLRQNVQRFENEAGPDIWGTNLGGMTATELVKSQALESFLTVILTNLQTGHPYTAGLTEDEQQAAADQALAIWNELTPTEQALFDIETLQQVREDILLHYNIRAYLTQNYVEHQRNEIFLNMFTHWRSQVNVLINFENWDTLDIEVFRP